MTSGLIIPAFLPIELGLDGQWCEFSNDSYFYIKRQGNDPSCLRQFMLEILGRNSPYGNAGLQVSIQLHFLGDSGIVFRVPFMFLELLMPF
jgi:hypothetical protein